MNGSSTTLTTIQIIVGLLTIVGSGVVSTIVTYTLNARKAQKDLLQAKLEILWAATHRYFNEIGLAYQGVMNGLKRGDNAEVIRSKSFKERTQKAAEAREAAALLVNIYFRDLLPAYNAVNISRKELRNMVRPLVNLGQYPSDPKALAKRIERGILTLQEASEALQAGIEKEAARVIRNGAAEGFDSVWKAFVERRLFPEWPKDSL